MNRHFVLSLLVLILIGLQSSTCQALDLWPFNNNDKSTSTSNSWWKSKMIRPTDISAKPKPAGPSMFTKVVGSTKKTFSTVGSALNPKHYLPKSMTPSVPKYLKPSYYYSSKKPSRSPTGYGKTTKRKTNSTWWGSGSTNNQKPSGMSSWVNGTRP